MCTTQTASYKVVKYFSSLSRIRTWLTCYFNNKGSTLLNGSGFDSAQCPVPVQVVSGRTFKTLPKHFVQYHSGEPSGLPQVLCTSSTLSYILYISQVLSKTGETIVSGPTGQFSFYGPYQAQMFPCVLSNSILYYYFMCVLIVILCHVFTL